MEFRLGTEQRVCGPGDVVVIRKVRNTRLGSAKTPRCLDFFPPPRDDFLLGGKPAYIAKTEQLAPSSHRQGDVQFAPRGTPRCERGSTLENKHRCRLLR